MSSFQTTIHKLGHLTTGYVWTVCNSTCLVLRWLMYCTSTSPMLRYSYHLNIENDLNTQLKVAQKLDKMLNGRWEKTVLDHRLITDQSKTSPWFWTPSVFDWNDDTTEGIQITDSFILQIMKVCPTVGMVCTPNGISISEKFKSTLQINIWIPYSRSNSILSNIQIQSGLEFQTRSEFGWSIVVWF